MDHTALHSDQTKSVRKSWETLSCSCGKRWHCSTVVLVDVGDFELVVVAAQLVHIGVMVLLLVVLGVIELIVVELRKVVLKFWLTS